jgi:hypothetical protein
LLRGHVAGRKDVGEKEDLLVDEAVGDLDRPTSANGTRAYCACPPGYPPSMWEEPKRPAGDRPQTCSAIQAFGFEFSQSEKSCCRHDQQRPHEIGNGTTTRSPTARFRTASPTSTTSPMNSWPSTSHFSMVGTYPL